MKTINVLIIAVLSLFFSVEMQAQDTTKVIINKNGELLVVSKEGTTTKTVKITMDSLLVSKVVTILGEDIVESRVFYDRKGLTMKVIENINDIYDLNLEYEDGEIRVPDVDGEIYEVTIDVEGDDWDEDDDEVEIERIYKKGKEAKSVRVYPNVKTRWLLVKFGISSYVQESAPRLDNGVNPVDLNVWPSINWGFDLFQTRFNVIKHYVNIKTGIGFDFNRYRFKNPVSLADNKGEVEWTYNENSHYSKNTLYVSYVKVPLLLNFETNPHRKSRSLSINAGVYGGLKLGSSLKQKWSNKDLVVKDGFNLQDWTYGLTGSIGYSIFNLYADYSLVGLFDSKADNNYVLTPFNVGIQLAF